MKRIRIRSFLALACVLLAFQAQANAESSITSAENDARRDAIHDTSFNWIYAGVCCSVFGIAAAAFVNAAPPTHRFVGKSPEYIEIYTQTYQRARRYRQMTLAAIPQTAIVQLCAIAKKRRSSA